MLSRFQSFGSAQFGDRRRFIAILISLALFLIGILMIVRPVESLTFVLIALLLVGGAAQLASYLFFRADRDNKVLLVTGAISLLWGIIACIWPAAIAFVFPLIGVLLGLVTIVAGVSFAITALRMKPYSSAWIGVLLGGVLLAIAGVALLMSVFLWAVLLGVFMGIAIILFSVVHLANVMTS